jgi:hypothetical protein
LATPALAVCSAGALAVESGPEMELVGLMVTLLVMVRFELAVEVMMTDDVFIVEVMKLLVAFAEGIGVELGVGVGVGEGVYAGPVPMATVLVAVGSELPDVDSDSSAPVILKGKLN